MKIQFASLVVAPLLAFALHASPQVQDSQSGFSPDQTGTSDCSDPLQAGSAQCSAQNFPLNPASPGSTTPYSNRPGGQPGQNTTYTDTERFTRQNGQSDQLQRTIRPEPLTEFQKFVAATTGQVLPIFGASLFRQVPSTFAPLDLTPVPPDYTIGPSDELRVRVWGQVNFRADVRVDRSGDIYLPQIGRVHVAGIPFSALDEHLRAAVGRIYRNFDLTADVGQIRAIQVYVAGSARRPGMYTVSSLSTLVDTLFASGGPSPAGSLRSVELRRGGTTVTIFDLYSLLLHGDKSKDMPLQSGDVIFIPPVGPQVAVTGSIHNPAIYELKKGESLAEALANAGDVSTVAAATQISIERIDDHRDRFAMEVTFDQKGLGTVLADGDLVRVYSIIPRYQKTVTLRGNTANPGRFGWHPGMKISELIPDKDSLITRNYWWKRAQLGLPAPEFQPLESFPNLRQPTSPVDLSRRRLMGQQINPGYPSRQGDAQSSALADDPETENRSSQQYSNSQQPDQYDLQQDPYGVQQDQTYQQDQTGLAAPGQLQGQDQYPASGLNNAQTPGYGTGTSRPQPRWPRPQLPERTPTRTIVGPIAPDIDWNYAVIERLDPETLKTVLIPFDLGRLVLQHDSSQDLPLMPGDVVSILSQDDVRVAIAQQTKFIRLDGEFVHAGVYTVKPGESLRDLVRRAGGLTENAYLYGSEFTRASTRQMQQRRMDEYIQTLELQMQRGNLALASSPASSAQDLASGAAAQTSEQQLLRRLRQMRATGRIVLEFRPGSNGIDALPDITLENGDRFVVPPLPASVNVVGSVYDQSSFLFASSRHAGAYLRLAGGPNRDADRKHIFIIRADGSVVSREAVSGLWGNEFDSLRMNPGDTIVVPDKSFRPSALRGILDWSQLFSQFALGAAALSIIQ